MAAPGDRLGDRYELIEVIGSGELATVWRARDTRLQRPVAIKVLRAQFASDPDVTTRFERAARQAAKLSHPNVAAVHDTGFDRGHAGGTRFTVMELVEGPSAAELLRGGRLPATLAIEVAIAAARALAEAHRRHIVHGAVKPGNLIVGLDGPVRLADFGMAAPRTSSRSTEARSSVGSSAYISPEQARGEEATPASDIFSLGVVLFQMLSGRLPMRTDVSSRARHRAMRNIDQPEAEELPAGLEAIVTRALEAAPERRHPSAEAFAEALEEAARGLQRLRTAPRRGGAVVGAAGRPRRSPGAEAPGSPPRPTERRPRAARAVRTPRAERAPEAESRTEPLAIPVASVVAAAGVPGSTDAPVAARPQDRQDSLVGDKAQRRLDAPVTPWPQTARDLPVDPAPQIARDMPVGAAAFATARLVTPARPPVHGPRRRRRALPVAFGFAVVAVAMLVAVALVSIGADRVGGVLGATATPPVAVAESAAPSPAGPSLIAVVPVTPVPSSAPDVPSPPAPSATPSPTASPVATLSPEPVLTPSPTARPTPRPTPSPTPAPAVAPATGGPTAAVADFYNAVEDHDWDRAISRWSKRMQRQYPPGEWLIGRFSRTTRIDITRIRQTAFHNAAGTATVAVTIVEYRTVEPSPRRFAGSWDLVRVGGRWLLDRPHF